MKKEPRLLLEKATDSLLLAVDHFNRAWSRGREEAVLVLLDRAFELLLKAAIVYKGGKIREPRDKETIGFDKCVRKCLSDADVKCLSDDEALTIQMINSLRDAAQHYLVDISERLLYVYSQAGVTLFGAILTRVFNQNLADHVPERALPVAATPPTDFQALLDSEFAAIAKLVGPKKRRRLEAQARLRALAIIEASLGGLRSQPSPGELDRTLRQIGQGKKWRQLFPGVTTLQLDTSGGGLTLSIRVTKTEGDPIRLVPEGTPGATVVAIRKISDLSYYSLGLHELATKLSLSPPRALALIYHLALQKDDKYFKTFQVGSQTFKRYSIQALDVLKKALPSVDMDEVWKAHKPKGRSPGGG